jgi:hypothetical protein
MHILFDSLSSQVQVQSRLKIRMNTLLGAIQSEGWTYAFSRDPITDGQLHGCDVLAILTRIHVNFTEATDPNPSPPLDYTSEAPTIQAFVKNGGGLLLISNHGPDNLDNNGHIGDPKGDLGDTTHDTYLANAFGVVIRPAHFTVPKVAAEPNGLQNTLMSITGDSLNSDLSDGVLFQVKEIAVHNACGIQGEKGVTWTSIAKIPKEAVDHSGYGILANDSATNEQQHYAITLNYGSGKVIVGANSGLAGDDGCTIPAPGTILYANNLLFLLNCFKYLAGLKLGF